MVKASSDYNSVAACFDCRGYVMPGPTFAITFDELQVIIATDRGYSRNPSDWNDAQAYVISDVTVSGIARVYFPPPINDEKISPDWTFLKPESTISLPAGATSINLPADFGSFCGPLTCQTAALTCNPWFIDWTNEGKLRQMQQGNPTMTGPPRFACEQVFRNIDIPVGGQRKGLMIFPAADQDYMLSCVYSINPDRLSGAMPLAYGGPQYRELYIASCLAVGELRFDNLVNGPKQMDFNRMLLAAVSQDNKNRPQKLGYNRDLEPAYKRWGKHWAGWQCLYNGQSFD